jgi:hypothetical protein
MDSGIMVQLFLGILWALGCALFVTFLLEFREDMSAHANYPGRARASEHASNPAAREIRSVPVADAKSQDPSPVHPIEWRAP